jgi:hypothetical protein
MTSVKGDSKERRPITLFATCFQAYMRIMKNAYKILGGNFEVNVRFGQRYEDNIKVYILDVIFGLDHKVKDVVQCQAVTNTARR